MFSSKSPISGHRIGKSETGENPEADQSPCYTNPFPVGKFLMLWKWIVILAPIAFVAAGLILFLSSPALADNFPASGESSFDKNYQLSLTGGATSGAHDEIYAIPEFYYVNRNLFGIQWQLDFLINLYHLDLSLFTPKIAHSPWTLASGIEFRRFTIRDGDFDDDEFKKKGVFEGFMLSKKVGVGLELFDRFHLYAEYDGKTYYNDEESPTDESYQVPSDFDVHELVAYATYKKLSYDEHRDVNYGYSFKVWGGYEIFDERFTYGLPGDERKQDKTIIRFGGSIRLYMMLFGPETVNLFLEGESLEKSIEAYRVDRYLAENYFTVKASYSPRIGGKSRVTPHLKVDFTELAGTSNVYFGTGIAVSHYFDDKLSLQFSYAYDKNRWGPNIYNATETGEHNIMVNVMYRWFN